MLRRQFLGAIAAATLSHWLPDWRLQSKAFQLGKTHLSAIPPRQLAKIAYHGMNYGMGYSISYTLMDDNLYAVIENAGAKFARPY